MLPQATVIVLNWNNFEDTRNCLEALARVRYEGLQVLLVDNGSTDRSCERLEERFPGLSIIRNSENLGFSRGCNAGIRAALRNPACRYVLLLNNDCILGPQALSAAVEVAEADAAVGLVTGKIVDHLNRIWHAGGTISIFRGNSRARGFRELDVGQFNEPCDTQWASGAMMLIKREVLEKVGALPEEYFFGVEEWDYSLRVLRAGYRIRYVPTFTGVHPGGGSHDNHDPKFAYNYYRQKLMFQERYLPRPLFGLWLIAFRAYLIFRIKRHVSYLAKITYADPADSPVDEVVFAAWTALRDHGKNALSEETMLRFEDVLKQWRAAQASERGSRA